MFAIYVTCNAISHVKYVLHFTSAIPAGRLQCPIGLGFFWQLLNFVLSWYNALLLSEDSEVVPIVPLVTGITFVFTPHKR